MHSNVHVYVLVDRPDFKKLFCALHETSIYMYNNFTKMSVSSYLHIPPPKKLKEVMFSPHGLFICLPVIRILVTKNKSEWIFMILAANDHHQNISLSTILRELFR